VISLHEPWFNETSIDCNGYVERSSFSCFYRREKVSNVVADFLSERGFSLFSLCYFFHRPLKEFRGLIMRKPQNVLKAKRPK